MSAKTKLGLLGGLALSAGIAASYLFAGWSNAPVPVPVDPLQAATTSSVSAAVTQPGHAGGADCCRSGHGDGKGAHAQCPMKNSAPAPAAKAKAASKCPYLAQVRATEKAGSP